MRGFLARLAARFYRPVRRAITAAILTLLTVLLWLGRRLKMLRPAAQTPAPSNVPSTSSPALSATSSSNDARGWFHCTPSPVLSTASSTSRNSSASTYPSSGLTTDRTHESVLTHPFSPSDSMPALASDPSSKANTEQIACAWHEEWPNSDTEDATDPSWLLSQSITLPLDLQEIAMRQIRPRWEGDATDATPPGVCYERRVRLETPVDDSEEVPSTGGSSEWSIESARESRRRMNVWMIPVNARFKSTITADDIAFG
jgi:hypothetical protein